MVKIYFNKFDTYIGLYRKPDPMLQWTIFYLVPIPCLVIEFKRSW